MKNTELRATKMSRPIESDDPKPQATADAAPSLETDPAQSQDSLGFKHEEAFMLMAYISTDGSVIETVWNSRDGAAPFMINQQFKKESSTGFVMLRHMHPGADTLALYHVPNIGDRIFVDLTGERLREQVELFVEVHWTEGAVLTAEFDDDKPAAVDSVMAEWKADGRCDLVEVTPEIQAVCYRHIRETAARLGGEGGADFTELLNSAPFDRRKATGEHVIVTADQDQEG